MPKHTAHENAQMKRKFYLRYRYEIKMIITILVLASGVFLFFKSFFDLGPNNLTTEILAALLGSILTVMITMLLIRQQGTVEQAYEAAVASKTKIFEEKLSLFKQFIQKYVKFAADGKLDKRQLAELEELAIIISLFTRKITIDDEKKAHDLGEMLCKFVLQLQFCGIVDSNNKQQLENKESELFQNYAKFMRYLNKPVLSPPEFLSFAKILRMMEAELGVDKLDIVESKDDVPNKMAKKLLAYREYQNRE